MTATDELMALLPCPFCGGDGVKQFPIYPISADCSDAVVQCEQCGALGPSVVADMNDADAELHWPTARSEAIAAWNRRAAVAPRIASGSADELQALLDKATAGEWIVCQCVQLEGDTLFQIEARVEPDMLQCVSTDIASEEDAAAAAAAVNWCRTERPALVAEVERLREALAEIASHAHSGITNPGYPSPRQIATQALKGYEHE